MSACNWAVSIVGVELLNLSRAAARYLRHEHTAVVTEVCHNAVDGLAGANALLVIGVARGRGVAGER